LPTIFGTRRLGHSGDAGSDGHRRPGDGIDRATRFLGLLTRPQSPTPPLSAGPITPPKTGPKGNCGKRSSANTDRAIVATAIGAGSRGHHAGPVCGHRESRVDRPRAYRCSRGAPRRTAARRFRHRPVRNARRTPTPADRVELSGLSLGDYIRGQGVGGGGGGGGGVGGWWPSISARAGGRGPLTALRRNPCRPVRLGPGTRARQLVRPAELRLHSRRGCCQIFPPRPPPRRGGRRGRHGRALDAGRRDGVYAAQDAEGGNALLRRYDGRDECRVVVIRPCHTVILQGRQEPFTRRFGFLPAPARLSDLS